MMFIKSALTVFCVTAMAAAQSVVTETETATATQPVAQTMETADPGSASMIDFGLTPSQTTAIEAAEMSIIASVEANPTFTSIVGAYATYTSSPFDKLLSDFAGDGSSLPTGTAARAAISSDIAALPTSGGVRDFFVALETEVYSQVDAILGTATAMSSGSGSGSATASTGSGASGTASGSAAAASETSNAGVANGVKGALGGVVILGAVMAML